MTAPRLDLTDGVVRLRPLGLDDVDAHLTGQDGQLARWLHGGLTHREDVEDHVRRCIDGWRQEGPVLTFGIRTVLDDLLVGTIDVHPDRPGLADGQADLAYGLYPHGRGQGHATRAVRLVCAFLLTRPGVRQAVIQVDPANAASAAVALRCGFRRWPRRPAFGCSYDYFVRDLRPA